MGITKEITNYPFYKKTLLVAAGVVVLSLPLITTQIVLRSTQVSTEARMTGGCFSECDSDAQCPGTKICKKQTCVFGYCVDGSLPVTPTPKPWWPTPIPTFKPVTPTPKPWWRFLF